MTSPTPPAQQAGIPLNQSVVNGPSGVDFTFAQPWFYLFQQLWRKLGGQYSTPQTMVYGLQTGAMEVTFYSVNTGQAIGSVTLT
jgi:hypothetical protein